MGKEVKNFLFSLLLATITLIIIIFFWQNYLLNIILLAIVGFLMIVIEGCWNAVLLYIVVFIVGPLGEAVVIYFGAWSYSAPQFMGITAWLPFLWGNAGLFIRQTNEFINYIGKNKK